MPESARRPKNKATNRPKLGHSTPSPNHDDPTSTWKAKLVSFGIFVVFAVEFGEFVIHGTASVPASGHRNYLHRQQRNPVPQGRPHARQGPIHR